MKLFNQRYTIRRNNNIYKIKFNTDGEDNYPHEYDMTRNGIVFTSGGGAATFEQAKQEALADIDEAEYSEATK